MSERAERAGAYVPGAARAGACAALALIALAAGCSAAGGTPGPDSGGTASAVTAAAAADADADSDIAAAYGFWDPCDDAMTEWFAARGTTHPEFIHPLLDELGSECSYTDSQGNGYALLSHHSVSGDAIDQWVHHLLGKSGPVSSTVVHGLRTEEEVIESGRARQDCHLVVTVDYGFLEITGGPNGRLDPPYPRDCDAVLDFADTLVGQMEARWHG